MHDFDQDKSNWSVSGSYIKHTQTTSILGQDVIMCGFYDLVPVYGTGEIIRAGQ